MAVTGLKEVLAAFEGMPEVAQEAVADALHAEALAIEAASVPLVPVDTGRLRSTHYVSPPERGSDTPRAEVGYGTDYAVYVHERTEIHHETGQAKFLEQPLQQARSGYAERIARRVQARLEKGAGK
jgi:hypothetical protein